MYTVINNKFNIQFNVKVMYMLKRICSFRTFQFLNISTVIMVLSGWRLNDYFHFANKSSRYVVIALS